MKLQTYPQAFGSSGAGWSSRSRRALTNKGKIGWRGKEKGERKRGRRDKTKVYTDRAQSPLVVDPGGQPDLGNTLWGLLLDLSVTPIKGPALESCPAAPQSPIFMFVLVAQWPPTSTNTEPRTLLNLAVARGNEGQGQLLIGYRCWAFDWQEGNAGSAGGCQLSSCSEKPLLQAVGY